MPPFTDPVPELARIVKVKVKKMIKCGVKGIGRLLDLLDFNV